MPEEQREYLWDIEHHFNRMNQIGFKSFADALRNNDKKALAALFASNFRGWLLDRTRPVRTQTDTVDVTRYVRGGTAPREVGLEEFLAELWKLRQLFDQPPGVKLAVIRLSPEKREQSEGAWHGTGQLRLWGTWQSGKPAEVIAHVSFRLNQPTTENLSRGGWLLDCAFDQLQIGKADRFLFREVAAQHGLEPHKLHNNWKSDRILVNTGGIYVFDFNRDGILDLLVTDYNGVFLYQGLPDGKFKNVTAEMGLLPENFKQSTPFAIIADLDGDGWDDLILEHTIYKNDAGKRFVNVTSLSNLLMPQHISGGVVCDYDRDGKLDLYLFRGSTGKAGSWITGKGGSRLGNVLFRNKGNWQFENVTDQTGTSGDDRSTFSAVWLDADDDGWPDLCVINEFGDSILYHNQGNGKFKPHMLGKSPTDFGSMGVIAGDLFNSGRLDIYTGAMYSKMGHRIISNMAPGTYKDALMDRVRSFVVGNRLHRNLGGLKFEEVASKLQVNDAGWAYGPAMADLDNDGWLDLYATDGHVSRDRKKPDG
jgi:hypothetical protein